MKRCFAILRPSTHTWTQAGHSRGTAFQQALLRRCELLRFLKKEATLPAIRTTCCASSIAVFRLPNSPSHVAKSIEPELRAVNVPGEKEETVFPRPGGHSGRVF